MTIEEGEQAISRIVPEILLVAEKMHPQDFQAWFCGGIITNTIGSLPDSYWDQFKTKHPCRSDFRLKPKPRIFYIEVWKESPDQGQITGRVFQTIVGASGKYIKVQEVIE